MELPVPVNQLVELAQTHTTWWQTVPLVLDTNRHGLLDGRTDGSVVVHGGKDLWKSEF